MAKIEKKKYSETYRHDRGWGYEIWVENLPEYCGKILAIDPGKRGSLHFHMNKSETMLVIEGHLQLNLVDPDTGKQYQQHLEVGDSIFIPRGQVHQIFNYMNVPLRIVEFSTTHEESDSYRVEKGD
jgi:mannose-6-phosphate isomerase-like protein (cupin superfamily)